MNTGNYDQLEMDEEALGDSAPWMQPGMKILAEYYNGRPIGIELPNSMVLAIVDTAPVFRGATTTGTTVYEQHGNTIGDTALFHVKLVGCVDRKLVCGVGFDIRKQGGRHARRPGRNRAASMADPTRA